MLHMLGSILINRNSFGVFASLTLCVCAFNPPPIVWWILCEKKRNIQNHQQPIFQSDSVRFGIGVGFGLIWFRFVISLQRTKCAITMSNTFEHSESHFEPLAMWFMKSWYNFRPSLRCLLGYLGNSLCQLPFHLRSLSPSLPLVVGRPAIQRIYERAFKLAANFKQNIHPWPHQKKRKTEKERERKRWF